MRDFRVIVDIGIFIFDNSRKLLSVMPEMGRVMGIPARLPENSLNVI
jgi:hypothetical protein